MNVIEITDVFSNEDASAFMSFIVPLLSVFVLKHNCTFSGFFLAFFIERFRNMIHFLFCAIFKNKGRLF